MGYYTQFDLTILDCPGGFEGDLITDVEKAVKDLNVFEPGGSAEYGWSGYTKWYYHDDDMITLSKKFPGVVFELNGDGEETEDVWCHYYKDGGVQRDGLVVTYTRNPFDESKLQFIGDKKPVNMEGKQ